MKRVAGVAGLVFVVLAFVARFVAGDRPDPSGDNAPAKFAEFYADSAHQTRALVSTVLGVIALFAFLWFLGGLWSRLRNADGDATTPTIIVAAGGAAFFALGVVSHLANDILGITLKFSDGYELDPGLAVVLSFLGDGAFMASMVAVGAATAAAGVIILRTNALPKWLAWIGFALAVLSLPLFPPLSFLAALLLAVWVVAASIVLLRDKVAASGTTNPAIASPA
ncbi:MAG TPA: hypothetical protein VGQ20_06205 [Acidimicrobiales bacterium]|jgi:hypothetical protein|nr:hypothetical protein [Acidimicrobiales bacterium]